MARIAFISMAVLATALSAPECAAQSLWHYRNPSRVFLFYDTLARRVGDVLTVVVDENTDVDSSDQRAMDKSTESGGLFDFQGSTGSGPFASVNVDGLLTSNRTFDGRAQYNVERGFSDRLTVSVLDVLPNGNLVIGGKRQRVVAGEKRMLVVSGIVRPNDVRPDNSVLSQYIANFEVYYEGKGPESHFSNQGWLGRFVNKIWPF